MRRIICTCWTRDERSAGGTAPGPPGTPGACGAVASSLMIVLLPFVRGRPHPVLGFHHRGACSRRALSLHGRAQPWAQQEGQHDRGDGDERREHIDILV